MKTSQNFSFDHFYIILYDCFHGNKCISIFKICLYLSQIPWKTHDRNKINSPTQLQTIKSLNTSKFLECLCDVFRMIFKNTLDFCSSMLFESFDLFMTTVRQRHVENFVPSSISKHHAFTIMQLKDC